MRREFEAYGPVKKCSIITDEDANPRGYAFIEFESDKDMKAAYNNADARKIEGRRILVDCERGRTVKGWLPMRLGGGKGGRKPKPKKTDEEREREARERQRERERGDRDDYDRERPSSDRPSSSRW